MKTRIKEIIILVSALFFVSTGVALAHDLKRGHPKPQKHAHGYHKKGHDQHFDWYKKHYKPGRHYRDKYHHREIHKVHYHYYDRHAPHYDWHNKHYTFRHHKHERYRHRKVHKVRHYSRHAPREEAIVAVKVKEPGFKFAVVVKEHR